MTENILTASRLRELVNYDPQTGLFTRLIRTSNRCSADGRADKLWPGKQKRMRVHLGGVYYWAHRLAWLFVYGNNPSDQIDHINGDATDNRISNLRIVTSAINSQNLHSAHPNNKYSGLLGVSWHPQTGKWAARIQVDGRQISLGLYFNPQDAHSAYLEAKRKLHIGCTI